MTSESRIERIPEHQETNIEIPIDGDEVPASLKRGRNWPLILGLGLVLLIVFLAIAGPSLAPSDPLKENVIIQLDNGKWLVPPFRIFTPGFPLGSDAFGRDLLSRLLFAIRPTLVMVAIVALVRLFLGILIGLLAGWSSGRLARTLDGLIALALSIPVLLVALGAIAVVGAELGIWAFIIGLALTGWVETAQQVREQTRIVKGQVYVEAAHALGASHRQILSRHVLKQILPMTAMLFAFEASSTLMATAGLGFLGYYIGGDVWINVGDFVAQRVSGMPELGQMLATSWAVLTQPWAMVAVGSTVFLAVLGFNLTGEGLRQSLDLAVPRRRGVFSRMASRAGLWLDQYAWYPLSQVLEKPAVRVVAYGALTIILLVSAAKAGGAEFVRDQVRSLVEITPISQPGHPMAEDSGVSSSASPDASQTGEPGGGAAARGIDWSYKPPYTILLQPAISPDGTAYLWLAGNQLQILDPKGELQAKIQLDAGPYQGNKHFAGTRSSDVRPVAILPGGDLLLLTEDLDATIVNRSGEVIWQNPLETKPVGFPLATAAGAVLLRDEKAGLSAFDSKGLRWRFQPEVASYPANGLVAGPDGTIYYVVTNFSKGFIQAVSPEGKGLWATEVRTNSFYDPLRISADGRWLFLAEEVIDTQTGKLFDFQPPVKIDEFIPGEDGKNYLRSGNTVMEWEISSGEFKILHKADWGAEAATRLRPPYLTRVDSNSVIWLYYQMQLVWLSPDGTIIGTHNFDWSKDILLSEDTGTSLRLCRFDAGDSSLECEAYHPGETKPFWKETVSGIPSYDSIIANGDSLYISTHENELIKAHFDFPK